MDFVCSDNSRFICVQIVCRYRTFLRIVVIDKISIRWSGGQVDFVYSLTRVSSCTSAPSESNTFDLFAPSYSRMPSRSDSSPLITTARLSWGVGAGRSRWFVGQSSCRHAMVGSGARRPSTTGRAHPSQGGPFHGENKYQCQRRA